MFILESGLMATQSKSRNPNNAIRMTTIEDMEDNDPYKDIAIPKVVCQRTDHTRKKNCNKNPYCLFGLGESKDGVGSAIIKYFQNEHFMLKRELLSNGKLSSPCGLKNLGATCYLNVLVQSLFHNLLVRDAVFNMIAEPNSDEGGNLTAVLSVLQEAFAHMLQGREGVYDLGVFVGLLGLNSGEQQDPQEFNKLFFGKVETLHLPLRDQRRVSFDRLISGQVRHCTVCMRCRRERAQEHVFHELDLSVEGHSSLDNAIAAYLSSETLDGDNQYECRDCNGRQDAERCTKIVRLPSVLCIHLLRYTYDKRTLEKRKLQSDLSYPAMLQLEGEEFCLVAVLYHKGRSAYGGHYVCDVLDWVSELWWHCDDASVSLTGNPTENMVEATDAVISLVDEASDASDDDSVKVGAKKKKRAPGSAGGSRKKKSKVESSSNSSGGSGVAGAVESDSSSQKVTVNRKRDSYMLSYVRASDFQAAIRSSDRALQPTEAIKIRVQAASEEFLQRVSHQEARCREAEECAKQRKELYQSIEAHLTPPCRVEAGGELRIPDDTLFHLVPTEWLSSWITGDCSSDNSDGGCSVGLSSLGLKPLCALKLMCKHQTGLALEHLGSVKALSHEAYSAIFASDEARRCVDYDFTSDNFRCSECFDQHVAAQSEAADLHAKMGKLVKQLEKDAAAPLFRVWRSWYNGFKKLHDSLGNSLGGRGKRSSDELVALINCGPRPLNTSKSGGSGTNETAVDVVDLIRHQEWENGGQQGGSDIISWVNGHSASSSNRLDYTINSGMLCAHGACSSRKQFVRVSAQTWRALRELYPNAIEVLDSAEPCEVCRDDNESEAEAVARARHAREAQLHCAPLAALLKRKMIYPSEFDTESMYSTASEEGNRHEQSYVMVDGQWMSRWRAYLKNSKLGAPQVEQLRNSPNLLCHHGLALVPKELHSICEGVAPGMHDSPTNVSVWTEDKGRREDGAPDVELISSLQWRALQVLHRDGLQVDDESQLLSGDDERSSCLPCQVRLSWDQSQSRWQFTPDVCLRCLSEMDERQKLLKVHFSSCRLAVKVFSNEEKLRAAFSGATLQPNKDSYDGDSSRGAGSRLSRSCKKNGVFKATTVVAASDDTVGLVKLKLYESYQTVDLQPAAQRLFSAASGVELDANARTLSDYGVRADDTLLLLFDTHHLHEDDGVMFLWGEAEARTAEAGFSTSMLGGLAAKTGDSRGDRNVVDLSEHPPPARSAAEEEAAYEQDLQRALRESEQEQF